MPTPTLSASETNQMRCATDPPDLMLSGSSSSRTKPQRRYVARDSGGPQGGRGKAGQGFHGARRGSSRARRESSPAYRGGPMAASATATSTPGSPIVRLCTSSATPARRSRRGSAASVTSNGIPTGTRNAPRSPGSLRRSRTSAANSSASAALYRSTSPASSPPNGNSANTEYTAAEMSTALRGVPRASVAASAPGKRPSCASTNGMREYTSSSALKSANALTIPATASQGPSHSPTTRVARSGHAPSVHDVQGVSASTGITETRYTTVTMGSARASARGYVVVACSISPPIVDEIGRAHV